MKTAAIDRVEKRIKRIIAAVAISGIAVFSVSAEATSIDSLEDKSLKNQREISSLEDKIAALLVDIEDLKLRLEKSEEEIKENEEEIEIGTNALEIQRQQMSRRIQFSYENSGVDVVELLMDAGTLPNFLNQAEYVKKVAAYDKEKMDSYASICEDLAVRKKELAEQKKKQKTREEKLEKQKAQLDKLLKRSRLEQSKIDKMLADAEQQALRREQLAAARAARSRTGSSTASSGSSDTSGSDEVSGEALTEIQYGVTGDQIIEYAEQFVGNPYVWGGNSLTDGCDCSGFVVQVYKHFDIHLGVRTSGTLRGVGREVSLDNIRLGDIVCYSGHVALYRGDGKIVEAQSSKAGITDDRAVDCKEIITIRRVVADWTPTSDLYLR